MSDSMRRAHDDAAIRLASEIREEGLFAQIGAGRTQAYVRIAHRCLEADARWPVTIHIGQRGLVRAHRHDATDETWDIDRWVRRGRFLFQRARGGRTA